MSSLPSDLAQADPTGRPARPPVLPFANFRSSKTATLGSFVTHGLLLASLALQFGGIPLLLFGAVLTRGSLLLAIGATTAFTIVAWGAFKDPGRGKPILLLVGGLILGPCLLAAEQAASKPDDTALRCSKLITTLHLGGQTNVEAMTDYLRRPPYAGDQVLPAFVRANGRVFATDSRFNPCRVAFPEHLEEPSH